MTGACPRCGAGPLSQSADGVCCVCLHKSPAPAPLGTPSVTAGRHRARSGSLFIAVALVVAVVVGFCGGVR